MRKLSVTMMLVAFLIAGLVFNCVPPVSAQEGTGTLQFKANGEDFVRQGFKTKDGWNVTFDYVYVALAEVTTYQADPPYDDEMGNEIQADVTAALDGVYTVDLAEGDENAEPILVGEVEAPEGFYNAISFKMVKAPGGVAEGYSLVVIGTAEKNGEAVDFTIKIDEEYDYTCGEYIGDMRKGILQEDGADDVEMTFHFDHIFGDAETLMDDGLDTGALGFAPLAALAQDDAVDVDLAALEAGLSADDYQKFLDILPTLGHAGEGHCHCELQ